MYEEYTCKCGNHFRQKKLAKKKYDACLECRRNPVARKRKTNRPNNEVWDDDKRKEKLSETVAQGLTPSEITKKYPRLYASLIKKFSSLYDACEYYGIETPTSGYKSFYQTAGFEFERLVGELLAELGYDYTKIRSGHCQPDFAIGNDWIDAKLSEWTINTCGTVAKYEPNCDSLTIVYLRGRTTERQLSDKTRLIHVSKYIEDLPHEKRSYFHGKIDEILTRIDEKEAV